MEILLSPLRRQDPHYYRLFYTKLNIRMIIAPRNPSPAHALLPFLNGMYRQHVDSTVLLRDPL